MSDFFNDQIGDFNEAGSHGSVSGGSGRVVTARGTEEGLILRIDGRSDWERIKSDVEFFLGERRKFFAGGEVSIEWLDRLPTKEQSKELEDLLRDDYGIEIVGRKKKDATPPVKARTREKGAPTISLFDSVGETNTGKTVKIEKEFLGQNNAPMPSESTRNYVSRMAKILGEDIFVDEEANAKVVFGTLRSGQRIESPFSLVIVGDVNPGADVIAGGDIVVLGSLRGTAHASAYEDNSFDRVIIALQMRPMQLRIGSVISRGSEEASRGMEIAHIEERRIVVESFHPRVFGKKKI